MLLTTPRRLRKFLHDTALELGLELQQADTVGEWPHDYLMLLKRMLRTKDGREHSKFVQALARSSQFAPASEAANSTSEAGATSAANASEAGEFAPASEAGAASKEGKFAPASGAEAGGWISLQVVANRLQNGSYAHAHEFAAEVRLALSAARY